MIQDAETINQIASWRAKIADGTITLPEMREAIKILRDGRHAALTASKATKAKKAKAPPKSSEELLKELGI